jgi:hypothetical protein
MREQHHIIAPARGEPLSQGRVGARIRVPLSGTPSAAWSRLMTGHLTATLVGHGPVGHLQCGGSVQGAEIVLDGVEDEEAERLGTALREAVDAANRACQRPDDPPKPANMDQAHADRVAADLGLLDERAAQAR